MINNILESDSKLGSARCSTFTCDYDSNPGPIDSSRYVMGETLNRNEIVIYPRRIEKNTDRKSAKNGLEIATVAEELHHMIYYNEYVKFKDFIGDYIENSNIDVHGEDYDIKNVVYGVMIDLPHAAEEIRAKELTKKTLIKLYRNKKIDAKPWQQQDMELENEIYSEYARVQHTLSPLSGIMSENDFEKVSTDLERFVKIYSTGRNEDLKFVVNK